MKIFRTNNDTEYFDIIKVCIENDIEHQKTGIYAHEQAAGAKRINLCQKGYGKQRINYVWR